MTDFETIDAALDRIRRHRESQRESPEDIERRVFLDMHGRCEESREKAFCWGMLAGGVIALTIYTFTLYLVGLL